MSANVTVDPLKGPSRPRIAIVDDDLTQVCIAELFLFDDYDVVCFSDPRQALFAILQDAPDAIVSDVHMPGMGGVALREALLRAGVDVPFVFLTGDGFAQGMAGAAGQGRVAWLEKPMDKAMLREKVAHLLADGLAQPLS